MAKRDIPSSDIRAKYPGNSYTERDNKENRKSEPDISSEKPRKVAQGKVRKQGLLRKFSRYIIEDTVESARERTLSDIVVPGIKTLIFDTATEILDLMLFGGTGELRNRRRRYEDRNASRTSYGRFYDERNRSSSRESYRDLPNDPDDIILDNRWEAQNVLEELDYQIQKYGQASIADYYDIVGVTSVFTDNKYGWTSLRDAKIKPVREGFMILLPRTRVLDN